MNQSLVFFFLLLEPIPHILDEGVETVTCLGFENLKLFVVFIFNIVERLVLVAALYFALQAASRLLSQPCCILLIELRDRRLAFLWLDLHSLTPALFIWVGGSAFLFRLFGCLAHLTRKYFL